MAESLQAFKGRIAALDKTASITHALSQISSSKVGATLKDLQRYESFNQAFNKIFLDVLKQRKGNPLVNMTEGSKRLFILISSDRGLVGGYHNQLFKAFVKRLEDFKKDDYLVFVIGKKGFYYAKKLELPLINEGPVTNHDDITTYTFKRETEIVLNTYLTGIYTGVELHYMHYENAVTQTPVSEQILPVKMDEDGDYHKTYHYDQPVGLLLRKLGVMYIETKIFGALTDAKMSEHASRLVAMKSATDNAKDIATRLNLVYHRLRQQEITNELIDIVNASSL